jgi:hypothetical protein
MATKAKPAKTPTPSVNKAPQSKTDAARSVALHLHEDDSWTTTYFTNGDLHQKERLLFGA